MPFIGHDKIVEEPQFRGVIEDEARGTFGDILRRAIYRTLWCPVFTFAEVH